MNFLLAAATPMPVHSRVNSKCYFIWNNNKDDIQIVWNRDVYVNPLSDAMKFSQRPTIDDQACMVESCVERPWCTDTGVFGWYYRGKLRYKWLRDNGTYDRGMNSVIREEGSLSSPEYGHQRVAVSGANLMFFTSGGCRTHHICVVFMTFSASVGVVAEAVTEIKLLPQTKYTYDYPFSMLTASRPSDVTLSFVLRTDSAKTCENSFAIDTVLAIGGHIGPFVHYSSCDTPSVFTASREVITVPGYTCRTYTDGRQSYCYSIENDRRYTWNQGPHGNSQSYSTLEQGYPLPKNLWLIPAANSKNQLFYPLVASGSAPIIALDSRSLWAVESCQTQDNYELQLIKRTLPWDNGETAAKLNTEKLIVAQSVTDLEPSPSAMHVKWAGPWGDGFTILVAGSMQTEAYHGRGSESESGTTTNEHVFHGSNQSVISLVGDTRRFLCPLHWPASDLKITAENIAAGSALNGSTECLQFLLTERNMIPDAKYSGCPIIAFSATNDTTRILLEKGADINGKCSNKTTPLMLVAGLRSQVLSLFLVENAAICTFPQNPFDTWLQDVVLQGNILTTVEKMAMHAPCEPGYFLVQDTECHGLTSCPEGYYCPGYMNNTNKAVPCPAGTYNNERNATDTKKCRSCPAERPYSSPGSISSHDCYNSANIIQPHGVNNQYRKGRSSRTGLLPTQVSEVREDVS